MLLAVSTVIKRTVHAQVVEFFTENNFEISKIMYFIALWLIAYTGNNKYGKNVLLLIFTNKELLLQILVLSLSEDLLPAF